MADWVVISDAQVDPDAPITSELGYAFRDNVIAMAEGASGAPRIQDSALNAGNITNNGGTFVGRRMANFLGRTGAEIGTVILAKYSGASPQISYNQTVSGSTLNPASGSGTSPISVSLAGTWVCLGYARTTTGVDGEATTLWCRIS